MIKTCVCQKSTCYKYNFGNKDDLCEDTPAAEEENAERAYFKVQNDEVIKVKVINTTLEKNGIQNFDILSSCAGNLKILCMI